MATVVNLKDVKKNLILKNLYDFIKEMWDSYETSPFSDCWLIEYLSECYMYSIKHFLPKYCWDWWITDSEYERLQKKTGGHCPVRDHLLPNGKHTRNHDLNIGPRHSKSSILNVFGPVWTILNTPITVVSVSHSKGLSGEMVEKKQKLLNSEKYKYYFGTDIHRRLAKNTADHLELVNGGRTYSVAMTKFTGFGADCFVAGTRIKTKDGYINIEDLREGDEVLSFNHNTNNTETSKVKATRIKQTSKTLILTTKSGKKIESTIDHKFYVENKGYKEISNIKEGSTFYTDCETRKDYLQTKQLNKTQKAVYDIQVEPNNNFFAEGILVHNCIINDDLISVADARMDGAVLLNARDYFKTTMPSRLNNKTTGVIWNIMQRIGRGDISDLISEDKGLKLIYSSTKIQAVATYDQTFIYPCSGQVKVVRQGDLLWEERFGDYSELKLEIGLEDFETQYNQDPAESKLNVIKDDYIHYIEDKEYEEFELGVEFHYGSHDCPIKDKEKSDCHGFVEAYSKGNELVITDAFEEHMAYVKEKEYLINLQTVDPAILQIVEDKANGAALLQDLAEDVPGLITFNPGTKSKMQRLELASIYMQQGIVRFRRTERVERLIIALKKFPLLERDDMVDAFSQLVIYHFTQRKLGVYSGAFTYQNIVEPPKRDPRETPFMTYGATVSGNSIKVVGVTTTPNTDEFVVEKEYVFKSIENFEEFCRKEVMPGCSVIDGSPLNRLSGLVTDVYNVIKFIEQDRDKSISILKSGFYKKKVKVSRDCKQTINDIARMRITEGSRERGLDQTETLDEGMSGGLRAVITYNKGYSQLWF